MAPNYKDSEFSDRLMQRFIESTAQQGFAYALGNRKKLVVTYPANATKATCKFIRKNIKQIKRLIQIT